MAAAVSGVFWEDGWGDVWVEVKGEGRAGKDSKQKLCWVGEAQWVVSQTKQKRREKKGGMMWKGLVFFIIIKCQKTDRV